MTETLREPTADEIQDLITEACLAMARSTEYLRDRGFTIEAVLSVLMTASAKHMAALVMTASQGNAELMNMHRTIAHHGLDTMMEGMLESERETRH